MADGDPPSSDTLLAEALDTAWRLLVRGAADRRSPVHTPVVASLDAAGLPDARVMVLRKAVREGALLRFHTDARSPKARALHGQPVSVLAYHPGENIQLRLAGTGLVETDSLSADAAWAASSLFARRCYMALHPPGAALAGPGSGLPAEVEGQQPTQEQIDPARPNFALLLVRLTRIDWLHLANTGHRRALFEAGDGWQGRWLAP